MFIRDAMELFSKVQRSTIARMIAQSQDLIPGERVGSQVICLHRYFQLCENGAHRGRGPRLVSQAG